MRIVSCDEAGLEVATSLLKSGGVAVIPTDTVYGLAAHPAFPRAVDRLYTIKGRDEKKPIALLASGIDAIREFGATISPKAEKLSKFWPGALTLVSRVGRLGTDEGFRIPNHDWTRRLLQNCGGVLRVTSANISGGSPATDAEAALSSVGLSADLVVDDGFSSIGVPSTVVRLCDEGNLEILRRGAIEIDEDLLK